MKIKVTVGPIPKTDIFEIELDDKFLSEDEDERYYDIRDEVHCAILQGLCFDWDIIKDES